MTTMPMMMKMPGMKPMMKATRDMTMPIMESTKTESTTMTDGEMILWLVTKGTMEDKPVLHLVADRIEALTAERDEYKRLALITDTVARECKIQEARSERAEADNARLREALTGIKKAAAHRMQDDPKDLHSYYFHTAAAALNGKEPSHE
jgi:hypothetical protein